MHSFEFHEQCCVVGRDNDVSSAVTIVENLQDVSLQVNGDILRRVER